MEKILKTIDALKMPSLSSSDANIPGTISSAVVAASDSVKTKKKERISHCRAVTDAVCTSSVQSLTDYNKILESVIEVLFQLCNDSDSDIRLVATDCLNRIARTLKDSLQPKLHMEVYKEIRKNQSPRSLRMAFNLFAFIGPMIRPQKCRAFMASLLPCFAQVSKRTEELLYENLATSFAEIFKQLGPFAYDSEIKILCKEFMSNLESTSAIIRRASASILVSICRFSKQPHISLPKLLSKVTELLMPNLMEKSVSVIIGVLLSIRQCIPPIYEEMQKRNLRRSSPEQEAVVANLLQVYEMCIILCNHDDHNVITTSLETLQQLFTNPVEPIVLKLTSPSGIQNSLDAKDWSSRQNQSILTTSMESLSFSDETVNLLEADLDVPKFRSVMSSSGTSDVKDESETEPSVTSSRRNSDVFIIEGSLSEPEVGDSSDGLRHSDEEASLKLNKKLVLQSFPEIQIGSLYEENVTIYYCARFLAYNFLLTGQKDIIRPDGEVRISAKVLATNCIVNLLAMAPEVFQLTLSHVLVDAGNEGEQQKIEDILLYASHSDPLLRGSIYILVGVYIRSIIGSSVGNLKNFPVNLESYTAVLKQGLLDSSNVGVKCAISGVNSCLHSMLRCESGIEAGRNLLIDVLQTAVNPYWLVKVDLLELLASVEWGSIDGISKTQELSLNLLLNLLSDEDARVRSMSATSLIRFMKKCAVGDEINLQSAQKVFCKECVMNEVNVTRSLIASRKENPCVQCDKPSSSGSAKILERVLDKMLENIENVEDKYAIAGHYAALANISECYKPRFYKSQWRARHGIDDINMLLSLTVETLRCCPVAYDLGVHQNILCLSGNLFRASDFYELSSEKEKPTDEGHPFRCHNGTIGNCGVQLLQHCLAVMKLYQNVMESFSPISALRKQSNSPVISPVKKFSQKLEAEKKAQESESEKKTKGHPFSDTVCQSHFKKINESLLQSWKVYKSSLDPTVTVKFTSLLIASLNTFRRLFTCIRPDFTSMTPLIEEMLGVSSAIFHLCPVPVMKSIREMLKCIFSIYDPDFNKLEILESVSTKGDVEDFLNFTKTYENSLIDNRSKSSKVSDKSSLGTYIRQFESVVVTALRIYTTSSDVGIQAEVLSLLTQLVKGHVNYGLVDSSQVFLGYVIKQVGFLEEGQIQSADLLVQEMFQFLTLLTHEHNSSKKFIDLPKVLRLCEGLVTLEKNSVSLTASSAVPALKHVVQDLFICRVTSSQSNLEKKEYETQRDLVVQMLTKLAVFPKVIPVMWILLKGRRNNEVKWIEDSEILISAILPKLRDGELSIVSKRQFNNLAAFFYSSSVMAIPTQETLVSTLCKAVKEQNEKVELFVRWCVNVNCHLIMLVKQLNDAEDKLVSSLSCRLVLDLIDKFLLDLFGVQKHAGHHIEFIIEQIGVAIRLSMYFFKWEKAAGLRKELRSDENVISWLQIAKKSVDLSVINPIIRTWMVELLSSILYPKIQVWDELLKTSPILSDGVATQYIIKIMSEINDGDVSALEEWIIVNYSQTILKHMSCSEVKLFLSRLSTYRMEQILDQITIILGLKIDMLLTKSILKYLERVADTFLCETAVLGIKLLQKTEVPFMAFEISQFCCYVFSHIRTRKMQLVNKDREFIREYLSKPSVHLKYPRLVTLGYKVLAEEPIFQAVRQIDNPIQHWCCEDLSEVEGAGLAKMLGSLKYTHIINILNSPGFNLSLFQHCFRNLKHLYQMGVMSTSEVTDLLTSQKRSGLIEKWPFAVAAIEFIVETLDGWENIVSESYSKPEENLSITILENPTFQANMIHMWSALTEMLKLKNAAIKVGESDEKECCNNFIPTGIFTLSFQFMAAKCQLNKEHIPFEDLRMFLKFAGVAVCDSSFLSFFDVRDNPPQIFACVNSLGSILRNMVANLGIDFIFSQSGADTNGDMHDDCIKVLNEFYYLIEFVQRVQQRKISMDTELLKYLKDVVAGLGRCELVNGWILISHLGWRPQVLSKAQIFPPIQQIPLEILRNEADMLLTYISKLNLLGVASKIQFEENWVIFLSVINLYVDESFQLQIVSTGLRALSMMLQQSIRIKYLQTYKSEKMSKAAAKIDLVLYDMEPEICRKIDLPPLTSMSKKELENEHGIDVNSCIRFLTDLFSQWLQNPQGKMPLHLLSEVIQSIVVMSEYFEDVTQYSWMYETLMEVFKSFEKEDEVLWPHLIYGIFYAAAKIPLETEVLTNLAQILESSLSSPSANIANASINCALAFLQNHPENLVFINVIAPYVLKSSQLDEITNDSENHCRKVWTLLLFIWIHGPKESFGTQDFEQEAIRNILTVLSSLNKVYVSVRLLVLKGLRLKVELGELKQDIKKTIAKVALETLRTPNICVFFQSLKLYLTMFYDDFGDFIDNTDLDPEVLMPMAERSDVLFQQLKSKVKCNNQIVAKFLPMLILDFLPPSEILNRVIAEFFSPQQTSPELLAPAVAQVFEKARRRPKEAALVREWILASLPNFVANADVSRTMWSLTLFFIGVSSTPDVACLLPFAQLRRRSTQIKQLFVHATLDFYSTLDDSKKHSFRKLMMEGPFHNGDEKKPYSFLISVLDRNDSERDRWAIDRVSAN